MRFIVPTVLALATGAVALTDCVTKYRDCLSDDSNTPGDCANVIAICKDQCAKDVYGGCLQQNGTGCMNRYNNCLDSPVSIAQTFYETDCVSKYTSCRSTGNNTEGFCSNENAECKNECNVVYGTCLSSGDADDHACLWQYDACLDSFTASAVSVSSTNTTTATDCVSKLAACDTAGVLSGAECSAENTVCKNSCAVIQDTCLTSGDASLKPMCLSQYDMCLDSSVANTALDCVSRNSACLSAGTSSADCAAQNTVCKNSCAVIQDTCRSSGDDTMTPLCTGQFDSCLGSYANGTALPSNTTSSTLVPFTTKGPALVGTGLATATPVGAAGNVTTGRNATATASTLAFATGAASKADVAGFVGVLALAAAFAL